MSEATAIGPDPAARGDTMRGENVIIFSSDDWSSGLKTSKYHLARVLAERNRVLFVNSVGLRAPGASGGDVGRAAGKLISFFKGPERVPEGLHVFSPLICPFLRDRPEVKALNAAVLRGSLRWLQLRLGLHDPVVFAFAPTFNGVVGALREKAIVYYCIDDLRGYDGVDVEWFDREEEVLLGRADAVIASAAGLCEDFESRGYRAHHVPHGVQWGMFRRAVDEDLPLPEDLRSIPEPRLGFYGFLSDEWVDYRLLRRMAAEHPDWHIVLIGRPKAGMDMAARVPEFNIHWLGVKPFEELPAYTRHFQVGLVPFCVNRLTRHSNPLKLLEYLSGGLPTVSTDIPEVHRYEDLVHIAGSHEEFIGACETALTEAEPAARDRRSRAARRHSWEERVRTISDIVYSAATGADCAAREPVPVLSQSGGAE